MTSEESRHARDILIVGGGTAGWMTAAVFAHMLASSRYRVRLVESDSIGTVGVGEATIPGIVSFNKMLGIDENEFLRRTQGTFKLGIQFVNWGSVGDRYMHPFGVLGNTLGFLPFYNYWLKYYQQGKTAQIEEFSVSAQAALRGRFMPSANLPNSPLSQITYAYHFDAGLYARFLRDYAEARGVQRLEGEIVDTRLRGSDGYIESVQLKDGRKLAADLFIDCSGFRGLLIDGAMNGGYEDWSNYLPCDRAVTVPSGTLQELPPYTRATAHDAGWQWRIPLQRRTGNGYVYSSRFTDDESARNTLLNNLEGEPLAEPSLIRFRTGMRKRFWVNNCVAIGLSAGFLEPLESTSIHLIQAGISKLLMLFPDKRVDAVDVQKYNDQMAEDYLAIRDFVVLHYKLTQRRDSRFWNHCRTMDVSDRLRRKIELYQANGRLFRDNNELFDHGSWLAVMHGQGLRSRCYHPLVDNLDQQVFERQMEEIRGVIERSAQAMPTHVEYIQKFCAAELRQ